VFLAAQSLNRLGRRAYSGPDFSSRMLIVTALVLFVANRRIRRMEIRCGSD
jgi:hypothetical protein